VHRDALPARALRASDAEREQVGELLQQAMSQGRITIAEFDERMGAAMAARTRGELEATLVDLPGALRVDMSYTAEISRANPACLVFLVDQSTSMTEKIGAGELAQSKAQIVADALNRLLAELTVKCGKDEGVRDYFHIAVIGYGASVGSALGGRLSDRRLVRISEVADAPARVEQRRKRVPDGAGGLVEQMVMFPVWVDPVADGMTPMCAALREAAVIVQGFVEDHPGCFPPVVLNLTDGDPTDGEPHAAASALTSVHSEDGNVLLFNLHVAGERARSISFPSSAQGMGTSAARLFAMSSVLPEHVGSCAAEYGFETTSSTRGFVYNSDVTTLVQFLDIGTRARDLR
jgi:hypothetical protein